MTQTLSTPLLESNIFIHKSNLSREGTVQMDEQCYCYCVSTVTHTDTAVSPPPYYLKFHTLVKNPTTHCFLQLHADRGTDIHTHRVLFPLFTPCTHTYISRFKIFPFTPVGSWRISHTHTKATSLNDNNVAYESVGK